MIEETLDLLKLKSPRVTVSNWSAAGLWHVCFFEGGTAVIDRQGPVLSDVIDACYVEAKKKANKKKKLEGLLG